MDKTNICIKAVVVCCMDFRFQAAVNRVIAEHQLDYGDYDLVSIKGGAGNFEQLEEHLEAAKKLHNPQKVILTIHEDCGAKAKKDDFTTAVEISKKVFGDDIPIVEKYLELPCEKCLKRMFRIRDSNPGRAGESRLS